MTDFMKIPEALEFVAGQSWLSPDEPVRAASGRVAGGSGPTRTRIGWREALRQIAGIVSRI
jgi:uncharacterized membrane protein